VNERIRILLGIVICLTSIAAIAQGGSEKHSVLVVGFGDSGSTYTLDQKPVPRNKGLLLTLSEARAREDNGNPELIVLIDERTRLSEVGNLIGLAGKAGYLRYRLFVFDKTKHWMSEIRYSSAMPFSGVGSLQKQKLEAPGSGPVVMRQPG
jgi:hypothetical protein